MTEGLLSTPFFERLNLWFIAALGVLVLYWLGRIAFAARQRKRPGPALWSVAGLLSLLLAPLTEVPALFGLGAAVLLLADWWPRAFVATGQRPRWGWGLMLVLVGAGVLAVTKLTYLSLMLGGALTLGGLAWLLSGLLWPTQRPISEGWWLPPSSLGKLQAPTFGSEWRWQPQWQPDPPDLSLSLGQGYLLLHNSSGQTVHLRGWSPTHRNTFLALDTRLPAAAQQRLSREPQQQGVRVWYTMEGQSGVRVLRTDWLEGEAGGERTLN